MRTEELRAELRAIADGIPEFEPDLMDLHRRNRGSRAFKIAAVVLAIVVVASAVALVGRHRNTSTAAPHHKEVPLSSLQRVDFLVVPADARAQRALETSSAVAKYAQVFHFRSPAGSPINSESSSNSVALNNAIRALDHSKNGGFAVQASGDAVQAHTQLQHALGQQVLPMWSTTPDVDAEIFMRVTAPSAQVEQVRTFLTRDTNEVASFTFFNHDDAYAEFKRLFANDPGLIQSTTPDVLPESFRVRFTDNASRSSFVAAAQRFAGVDGVVSQAPSELFEVPPAAGTP